MVRRTELDIFQELTCIHFWHSWITSSLDICWSYKYSCLSPVSISLGCIFDKVTSMKDFSTLFLSPFVKVSFLNLQRDTRNIYLFFCPWKLVNLSKNKKENIASLLFLFLTFNNVSQVVLPLCWSLLSLKTSSLFIY